MRLAVWGLFLSQTGAVMRPALTAAEVDEALGLLDQLCAEVQEQYLDLAASGDEQRAADLLAARTAQLPGAQRTLLFRLFLEKNVTVSFYST
jgi:hypothetical protein